MPQLYKLKFRLIKDHLHPYCCRSVTQSCLFVTAARQGSLSLTISQSFLKINISLYSSVKLVVGVEQEIYFPVKDLTVKSIRIHCFLCVRFWFILSISFSGFVTPPTVPKLSSFHPNSCPVSYLTCLYNNLGFSDNSLFKSHTGSF